MIRLTCPCGKMLQTRDEHAGKAIRCPQCQGQLRVPDRQEDDFVPVEMVEGIRPGTASIMPSPSWEPQDGYEDRPRRREYTPPEARSGKALISLYLGILALGVGLVLGFVAPLWSAAIPAVLGLISLTMAMFAMADVKHSQGRLGGHGLALTGLILGALAIPMYLPGYLVKPNPNRIRNSAARLMEVNNFKQIGLAFHNYAATYGGKLPEPGNLDQATSKPLLSWRVHLLPYLGEDRLYRQFNLNEAWDSPNNLPLLNRMPAIYRSEVRPAESTMTTYQMLVGPNTLYPDWPPKGPGMFPRRFRINNIPDGSSNTFFVVESSNPVPWTKAEDIAVDPLTPVPSFGWSYPAQFLALFGDGSVRDMKRATPERTLRLYIDPADAQVIPFDDPDER
jgi:hypothetical protein